MPRRVYTYLPEIGLGHAEPARHASARVMIAASVALFLVNVGREPAQRRARRRRSRGAPARSSGPPPRRRRPYNFHRIPVVHGRVAAVGAPARADAGRAGLRDRHARGAGHHRARRRARHRMRLPEPTIWPFLAALATGVTFIVSIFTPWGSVGAVLITGALRRLGLAKGEGQAAAAARGARAMTAPVRVAGRRRGSRPRSSAIEA